MVKKDLVKQIAQQFTLAGPVVKCYPMEEGLINLTYCLECAIDKGIVRYVIQRINDTVFTEPEAMMSNIESVVNQLQMYKQSYPQSALEPLVLNPTKSGTAYFYSKELGYWRVYNFIENSIVFQQCDSVELAYNAGLGFGEFVFAMSESSVSQFVETIPQFHDTENRYENLKTAYQADGYARAISVVDEMKFFNQNTGYYTKITQELACQNIPWRIIHNDTKISNILFDRELGTPLSVIDLDTVMPGSVLYDFGDLIRTLLGQEDEKCAGQEVGLDMGLYASATNGFIEGCADLNTRELELLPLAPVVITLELAMRFLTDYLEGDKYFRTNSQNSDENLRRCRQQLALVKQLIAHQSEVERVIKDIVGKRKVLNNNEKRGKKSL